MENLQILHEAMSLHSGVLRYADSYTIGRNNGGIYIKLFHNSAKWVICTIYENSFGKLPKEIAEKAMKIGSTLEPEMESVTNQEIAKKKGMLNQMPLMMITRFQFDPGEDKEKWRFYGIYKIFAPKPTQQTQAPTNGNGHTNGNKQEEKEEAAFTSFEEAASWAIQQGAYQTYEQAEVALRGLKQRDNSSGIVLSNSWRNVVNQIVVEKNKRKEKAR
jgi:hypothetical protein